MSVRIVIMTNRFVSVGTFADEGDGWYSLDNAAIVRRWGTTKGLGEIAEGGPTANTKLDPTPKQRFPSHAVINTIECDAKKWKTVLGL